MRSFTSFKRAAGKTLANSLPTSLVLCYHRVTPEGGPDPWSLKVRPERFAQQLEVLRDFDVRPLKELLEAKERSVAITFDDGYDDNLDYAAPLLSRFSFPATFFLVTGDPTERFWWDLLCDSGEQRRHRELLAMTPQDRSRHLRVSSRPSQRLSAERIQRLAEIEHMEIGAHTISHPLLSQLPPDEVKHELLESRLHLERLIGKPVCAMSYPHGTPPTDLSLVADCGYSLACTTTPDRVWKYSDPLRLPRFLVQNWTGEEFRTRLERWWS